jgi:molybdopterin-guanine dinucleotide biosynthesis protein MobB
VTPSPPVVSVIGRKNSGKTELTVALAAELNRRGRRVMTVKRGHGFDVDRPGKDSWRHRHEGGVKRTVLAGPGEFAVIGTWPRGEGGRKDPSLKEIVGRYLHDADLVLAEGFKSSDVPRVEAHRLSRDPESLLAARGEDPRRWIALVTDGPDPGLPIPVFTWDDPDHAAKVASLLEERLLGREDFREGGAGR